VGDKYLAKEFLTVVRVDIDGTGISSRDTLYEVIGNNSG
jgi:hypothetical protein